VHRKQLELPREICPVSLRRLREPRGNLTAGQKSAEGVVDHAVGKASKEQICEQEGFRLRGGL